MTEFQIGMIVGGGIALASMLIMIFLEKLK